MQRTPEDDLDILKQLLDRHREQGAYNERFAAPVLSIAEEALRHADTRYMPGFKRTALMADLANEAASLACDTWLSPQEAERELNRRTGGDSPLIRQFRREAAIERARYEPVMLQRDEPTPLAHRNALLRLRFHRMVEARQSYAPLRQPLLDMIRTQVESSLVATSFLGYRVGPMLQLFAEMLECGERAAARHDDPAAQSEALDLLINEHSVLWRRYAGKASRFRANATDPLITGIWPGTQTVAFTPTSVTGEALH